MATRAKRIATPASPDSATAGQAQEAAGRKAPSAAAEDDIASQVLQQFRIVLNGVKSHFRQVERSTGVSGSQVWALSVIRNHPGIGVGDLARALSVKQPTASILVRNLAQRGLIEPRRLASDRRAVKLHALPAADRLLDKVPGPHSGLLPQALALLGEPTLERMRTDMARLIGLLAADERFASRPLDSL